MNTDQNTLTRTRERRRTDAAVESLRALLRNPQRSMPSRDIEVGRVQGSRLLLSTKGHLIERMLSVGLTGHDDPEWGVQIVNVRVSASELRECIQRYALSSRQLAALRARLRPR